MNYFQNKKIEEHFKNNNVGTDIDITEQSIREMLILSGYTTSEIAALLFTVMRNILLYEKNLEMFHE